MADCICAFGLVSRSMLVGRRFLAQSSGLQDAINHKLPVRYPGHTVFRSQPDFRQLVAGVCLQHMAIGDTAVEPGSGFAPALAAQVSPQQILLMQARESFVLIGGAVG